MTPATPRRALTPLLAAAAASLLVGCAVAEPNRMDASVTTARYAHEELPGGHVNLRLPAEARLPLPWVAVGEPDLLDLLREYSVFEGYRRVEKKAMWSVTAYGNYFGSGYGYDLSESMHSPAGSVAAATSSEVALRPGEVLLDLVVESSAHPKGWEPRFELRIVGADGVPLVRHAVSRRIAVQSPVAPATEAALLADVRAAAQAARATAIRQLVQSLLDDRLTLETLAAGPGAKPAGPVAAADRGPAAPQAAPLRQVAGRTLVLAVGVDAYADADLRALGSAEADARAVAAFYALHRRSPAAQDQVKLLVGKDATRAGVLEAVRTHLGQRALSPDDAVVLFFAGHGLSAPDGAYLACADTRLDRLPETAISLEALRGYWEKLAAGTKLLLVDACHAGALAGTRGVGGLARATTREQGLGAGTVVVAASAENQLSSEHRGLGRGVFTTALLHGLGGDADRDGDRVVTLAELQAYLGEEVPRQARAAGAVQTPVVTLPSGLDRLALTR